MSKTICKRCGKNEKPYRRAWGCRGCWTALSDATKAALAKATTPLRTLSLRDVVVDRGR